jgi:hypothetical protein
MRVAIRGNQRHSERVNDEPGEPIGSEHAHAAADETRRVERALSPVDGEWHLMREAISLMRNAISLMREAIRHTQRTVWRMSSPASTRAQNDAATHLMREAISLMRHAIRYVSPERRGDARDGQCREQRAARLSCGRTST